MYMCVCVCVCVMQRRVLREEVAGIARPVGVRLRGRKALGAEKPLPHPGHPGKATCLNCSNTRNAPWFQVSHLCVPEAGRSKSKEPYSRGTTPEAEGLAHRGASLPQQDGPSQGCSLPPTGCSLTGVPPSPSRILPHRSAPFLQQDPPSQGYSPSSSRILPHRGTLLPPAGSSLTGVPPSSSRILPYRGTPFPQQDPPGPSLLQMNSSMHVAALPCLSLMLLLWSPGPWVRGQEFQFGPCRVEGVVLQKLWQAFWAMKDIVVSEVLFWTQPWREVIWAKENI